MTLSDPFTPDYDPNKAPIDSRYEFVDILGEGEFSSVVLGESVDNPAEKVAIKILDKKKIKTAKQRWRVTNEIELHRTLRHPNIVALQETFESNEDVCIVLG